MRTALLAILATAFTGCTVYSQDVIVDRPAPAPILNSAPYVMGSEAGVYWDDYNRDDIWYFETTVDDPDGVYDVVSVWADVYDDASGGYLVDSFELYPTNDPYVWFSDWLGRSTYLDPFWGGYTVEFVAYDSYESVAVEAVIPYTYR